MTQLAKSTDALLVHQDAASRSLVTPNPQTSQLSYNLALHAIESWNGSAWVTEMVGSSAMSVLSVQSAPFYAKGDGVNDDTAAIQAAIDALPATGGIIYFPAGTYKVTGTLAINRRGVRFVGVRDGRVTQGGGSRLAFSGTLACVRIGTSKISNATLYDASYANADYDGYQEFYAENLSFEYVGATTTALLNGRGSYGTGTVAIQDWRGGSVRLHNVMIEKFEYGFWGLQSDVDAFDLVTTMYCRYGVYLGPRSDQARFSHFYPQACDTAVWLDRCSHAVFARCEFVSNGSPSTFQIRIGTQYTVGSAGHEFDHCWFETGNGNTTTFPIIGIGVGDTVSSTDIAFRDPFFVIDGTALSTSVWRLEQTDRVFITNPKGNINILSNMIEFVGTTGPHVHIEAHEDRVRNYLNSGTGAPQVSYRSWGYGYTALGSNNGRVMVRRNPAVAATDFFLGSESQFGFFVNFPGLPSGDKNLLALTRRIQHSTAAPVAGTWSVGDIVVNTAPAEAGTAGSKYITLGWTCTVAGTPGTWLPMRTLTGN